MCHKNKKKTDLGLLSISNIHSQNEICALITGLILWIEQRKSGKPWFVKVSTNENALPTTFKRKRRLGYIITSFEYPMWTIGDWKVWKHQRRFKQLMLKSIEKVIIISLNIYLRNKKKQNQKTRIQFNHFISVQIIQIITTTLTTRKSMNRHHTNPCINHSSKDLVLSTTLGMIFDFTIWVMYREFFTRRLQKQTALYMYLDSVSYGVFTYLFDDSIFDSLFLFWTIRSRNENVEVKAIIWKFRKIAGSKQFLLSLVFFVHFRWNHVVLRE